MGPTAGQAAIWAGWRVSCSTRLPLFSASTSGGEKQWWNPPGRITEPWPGLGVMDIKQPRCLLACYKGKEKLLALMSFQCGVTLDIAKSFSLPGLTRGSTELEQVVVVGAGHGEMPVLVNLRLKIKFQLKPWQLQHCKQERSCSRAHLLSNRRYRL